LYIYMAGSPCRVSGPVSAYSSASPCEYVAASALSQERRAAMGLTPTHSGYNRTAHAGGMCAQGRSLSHNQSFPLAAVTQQMKARMLDSPSVAVRARGLGLGGQEHNFSLLDKTQRGLRGYRLMQNPNKAWAVISRNGGEVLVSNSLLSTLLGYKEQELRGRSIWELMRKRRRDCAPLTMDQMDLSLSSGESVAVSGRVVSLETKGGSLLPVALTVTDLKDSSRQLLTLEPVAQTSGTITLDPFNKVSHMDEGARTIFQAGTECEVHDLPVGRLLPDLSLPDDSAGSCVSLVSTQARTLDSDSSFPASCRLVRGEAGDCELTLWVYSCLSGLLLLSGAGSITEADPTFCSLVLGYHQGVQGLSIEQVLPGFYEEFQLQGEQEQELREQEDGLGEGEQSLCGQLQAVSLGSPVKRPSSLAVTPVKVSQSRPLHLTSTPAAQRVERESCVGAEAQGNQGMPEGCFYGLARHVSGAELAVLYQVKKVLLEDGEMLFTVWVTRDSEDAVAHTWLTLGTTSVEQETQELDGEQEEEFERQYCSLQQVGQGAFGSVWLGYRRQDRLLVVTKFITRERVAQGSWVEDKERGWKIPLEASLLLSLSHENIVSVLDVLEGRDTVQLVMAKHGDMDLFEFIERQPLMEEGLGSLLLRQVVQAVAFLHSRGILHRDIKDENVILDYNFHCKLIDFGSATYFSPGEEFSTFYGTLEYCAPEVLSGKQYLGPPAEVWALGVLAYIIMFGENPFYSPLDTLRGELHPPSSPELSAACWAMLHSCLSMKPGERAELETLPNIEWLTMEVSTGDYSMQDIIATTEEERRPTTHYRHSEAPTPSRQRGRQLYNYSQDGSLEEGRDLETSSTKPDYEYLETSESKDYSNLIRSADLEESVDYSLDRIGDVSVSSVEYSNLLTSQQLEELELAASGLEAES